MLRPQGTVKLGEPSAGIVAGQVPRVPRLAGPVRVGNDSGSAGVEASPLKPPPVVVASPSESDSAVEVVEPTPSPPTASHSGTRHEPEVSSGASLTGLRRSTRLAAEGPGCLLQFMVALDMTFLAGALRSEL